MIAQVLNTIKRGTFPQQLPASAEALHAHDRFFGFNRQYIRAALALDVMKRLACDAFIETGAHKGATSWLVAAQTSMAVFSSELRPASHRRARLLLMPYRNARVFHGDSRSFLRKVAAAQRPFIYLDAHWFTDLPLREELDIIGRRWRSFIVLIDDFRVPHDNGFGYDSYEAGTLEWDYVQAELERMNGAAYYPAYSSEIETGAKRGFLLIGSRDTEKKLGDYSPSFLVRA